MPCEMPSPLYGSLVTPLRSFRSGNGERDARCKFGQFYGGRGIDRVWGALEAVQDGNKGIFDAPVSQIVLHREPVFGPLIIGDPETQNLTFAFYGDTQRHVNGLAFDPAAFGVANFYPKSIKENDWRLRLQGAVLPIGNLCQNGIGDPSDEIG